MIGDLPAQVLRLEHMPTARVYDDVSNFSGTICVVGDIDPPTQQPVSLIVVDEKSVQLKPYNEQGWRTEGEFSRARIILGLDPCDVCLGSRRCPDCGGPCEVCTRLGCP